MLNWQEHKQLRIIIRIICVVLMLAFVSYDLSWAGATEVLSLKNLPSLPQVPFVPPTLKYLSVNEANPHNYFNFLLDKGLSPKGTVPDLNAEAKKLINYFFLGITLPDNVFWVNLKPAESRRITSEQLSRTDLGRTLLEQDFRLKRDVSQYLNPHNPIGRQFWEKLYSALGKDRVKKAGITTSNRVWIVPAEAVVIETEDGALLAKSSLKVLLESEYAALKLKPGTQSLSESSSGNSDSLQSLTEQLMKEIVIPAITKDVNESQNYAPLRQIYHSLILAQWFKRKHKNANSTYAQAINKGYLKGLESRLPWEKQQIWQEYLKSYSQGEYKIQDTVFGLKRMYFSGGVIFDLGAASMPLTIIGQKELPQILKQDPDFLNKLMKPGSFKDDLVVITERKGDQGNSEEQPLVQDINIVSSPGNLPKETTIQQAEKEKPELQESTPAAVASSPSNFNLKNKLKRILIKAVFVCVVLFSHLQPALAHYFTSGPQGKPQAIVEVWDKKAPAENTLGGIGRDILVAEGKKVTPQALYGKDGLVNKIARENQITNPNSLKLNQPISISDLSSAAQERLIRAQENISKAQEQIAPTQATIERLKNAQKELNDKTKTIEERNKALENEVSALKERLNGLEGRIKQIEDRQGSFDKYARNWWEGLGTGWKAIMYILAALGIGAAILGFGLYRRRQRLEQFRAAISQKEEEKQRLDAQIETQKQTITDLNAQIEQVRLALAEAEKRVQEIAQKQEGVVRLDAQKQRRIAEEELSLLLKEEEAKLIVLKENVTQLQQEQTQYEETVRTLKTKIAEYQQEIGTLEERKDKTRQEGLSISEEVVTATAYVDEVNNKIKESEGILKGLKEEISSLETNKQNLETDVTAKQDQKQKLEAELARLNQESQNLSQSVAVLNVQSQSLSQKEVELKSSIEEKTVQLKDIEAKISALQVKGQEQDLQIPALEERKKQLEIELAKLSRNLSDLTREAAQAQQKIEQEQISLSWLEKDKEKISPELKELETKRNQLRQEMDTLDTKKSGLEAQVAGLTKALADTQKELSEAQDVLKGLLTEIEKLETMKIALSVEEIPSLEQQRNTLRQEIEELGREKRKLEEEVETIKKPPVVKPPVEPVVTKDIETISKARQEYTDIALQFQGVQSVTDRNIFAELCERLKAFTASLDPDVWSEVSNERDKANQELRNASNRLIQAAKRIRDEIKTEIEALSQLDSSANFEARLSQLQARYPAEIFAEFNETVKKIKENIAQKEKAVEEQKIKVEDTGSIFAKRYNEIIEAIPEVESWNEVKQIKAKLTDLDKESSQKPELSKTLQPLQKEARDSVAKKEEEILSVVSKTLYKRIPFGNFWMIFKRYLLVPWWLGRQVNHALDIPGLARKVKEIYADYPTVFDWFQKQNFYKVFKQRAAQLGLDSEFDKPGIVADFNVKWDWASYSLELSDRSPEYLIRGYFSGDCTNPAVPFAHTSFQSATLNHLVMPGFFNFKVWRGREWIGNIYAVVIEHNGKPVLVVDAVQIPWRSLASGLLQPDGGFLPIWLPIKFYPVWTFRKAHRISDAALKGLEKYAQKAGFAEIWHSSFVSNFTAFKNYYGNKYNRVKQSSFKELNMMVGYEAMEKELQLGHIYLESNGHPPAWVIWERGKAAQPEQIKEPVSISPQIVAQPITHKTPEEFVEAISKGEYISPETRQILKERFGIVSSELSRYLRQRLSESSRVRKVFEILGSGISISEWMKQNRRDSGYAKFESEMQQLGIDPEFDTPDLEIPFGVDKDKSSYKLVLSKRDADDLVRGYISGDCTNPSGKFALSAFQEYVPDHLLGPGFLNFKVFRKEQHAPYEWIGNVYVAVLRQNNLGILLIDAIQVPWAGIEERFGMQLLPLPPPYNGWNPRIPFPVKNLQEAEKISDAIIAVLSANYAPKYGFKKTYLGFGSNFIPLAAYFYNTFTNNYNHTLPPTKVITQKIEDVEGVTLPKNITLLSEGEYISRLQKLNLDLVGLDKDRLDSFPHQSYARRGFAAIETTQDLAKGSGLPLVSIVPAFYIDPVLGYLVLIGLAGYLIYHGIKFISKIVSIGHIVRGIVDRQEDFERLKHLVTILESNLQTIVQKREKIEIEIKVAEKMLDEFHLPKQREATKKYYEAVAQRENREIDKSKEAAWYLAELTISYTDFLANLDEVVRDLKKREGEYESAIFEIEKIFAHPIGNLYTAFLFQHTPYILTTLRERISSIDKIVLHIEEIMKAERKVDLSQLQLALKDAEKLGENYTADILKSAIERLISYQKLGGRIEDVIEKWHIEKLHQKERNYEATIASINKESKEDKKSNENSLRSFIPPIDPLVGYIALAGWLIYLGYKGVKWLINRHRQNIPYRGDREEVASIVPVEDARIATVVSEGVLERRTVGALLPLTEEERTSIQFRLGSVVDRVIQGSIDTWPQTFIKAFKRGKTKILWEMPLPVPVSRIRKESSPRKQAIMILRLLKIWMDAADSRVIRDLRRGIEEARESVTEEALANLNNLSDEQLIELLTTEYQHKFGKEINKNIERFINHVRRFQGPSPEERGLHISPEIRSRYERLPRYLKWLFTQNPELDRDSEIQALIKVVYEQMMRLPTFSSEIENFAKDTLSESIKLNPELGLRLFEYITKDLPTQEEILLRLKSEQVQSVYPRAPQLETKRVERTPVAALPDSKESEGVLKRQENLVNSLKQTLEEFRAKLSQRRNDLLNKEGDLRELREAYEDAKKAGENYTADVLSYAKEGAEAEVKYLKEEVSSLEEKVKAYEAQIENLRRGIGGKSTTLYGFSGLLLATLPVYNQVKELLVQLGLPGNDYFIIPLLILSPWLIATTLRVLVRNIFPAKSEPVKIRNLLLSKPWYWGIFAFPLLTLIYTPVVGRPWSLMGRQGLYSYWERRKLGYYRVLKEEMQGLSKDFRTPGEKFRVAYDRKNINLDPSLMQDPVKDELTAVKEFLRRISETHPDFYKRIKNIIYGRRPVPEYRELFEVITPGEIKEVMTEVITRIQSWNTPNDKRVEIMQTAVELVLADQTRKLRRKIFNTNELPKKARLNAGYWQQALDFLKNNESITQNSKVSAELVGIIKKRVSLFSDQTERPRRGLLQFYLSGVTFTDFFSGSISIDCTAIGVMHFSDFLTTKLDPAFMLFKVVENGRWVGNLYTMVLKDSDGKEAFLLDSFQLNTNHPLLNASDGQFNDTMATFLERLKLYLSQQGFKELLVGSTDISSRTRIKSTLRVLVQQQGTAISGYFKKPGGDRYRLKMFAFAPSYLQALGTVYENLSFSGHKISLPETSQEADRKRKEQELQQLQQKLSALLKEAEATEAQLQERQSVQQQLLASLEREKQNNREASVTVLSGELEKVNVAVASLERKRNEIKARITPEEKRLEELKRNLELPGDNKKISKEKKAMVASLLAIGFLLSTSKQALASGFQSVSDSWLSGGILVAFAVGVGIFFYILYRNFKEWFRVTRNGTPDIAELIEGIYKDKAKRQLRDGKVVLDPKTQEQVEFIQKIADEFSYLFHPETADPDDPAFSIIEEIKTASLDQNIKEELMAALSLNLSWAKERIRFIKRLRFTQKDSLIDQRRFVERLSEYLGIPSKSGKEEILRDYIASQLEKIGGSENKIPQKLSYQAPNNLIWDIPASENYKGEPLRIALHAHLDTGTHTPTLLRLTGNSVIAEGKGKYAEAGLDDAVALAVITEALEVMKEKQIPHPNLRLIFTAEEEAGPSGVANGARYLVRDHPELFEDIDLMISIDGPLLDKKSPLAVKFINFGKIKERVGDPAYKAVIEAARKVSGNENAPEEFDFSAGDEQAFKEIEGLRIAHFRANYAQGHTETDNAELEHLILLTEWVTKITSSLNKKPVPRPSKKKLARGHLFNSIALLSQDSTRDDIGKVIANSGKLAPGMEFFIYENSPRKRLLQFKYPALGRLIMLEYSSGYQPEYYEVCVEDESIFDAAGNIFIMELLKSNTTSLLSKNGKEIYLSSMLSNYAIPREFNPEVGGLVVKDSDNLGKVRVIEFPYKGFVQINAATKGISRYSPVKKLIPFVHLDVKIELDRFGRFKGLTLPNLYDVIKARYSQNDVVLGFHTHPDDIFSPPRFSFLDMEEVRRQGKPFILPLELLIGKRKACFFHHFQDDETKQINEIELYLDKIIRETGTTSANNSLVAFNQWLNTLPLLVSGEKRFSAKGRGMFTLRGRDQLDQAILQARQEGRGYLIWGDSRGWKDNREEYTPEIKSILGYLQDYSYVNIPGLGIVNIPKILSFANIILLRSRDRSPCLVFNNEESFQIAFSDIIDNSIKIDAAVYASLSYNYLEKVALLAHEAIELGAMRLAKEQNIPWTLKLANEVIAIAEDYEIQISGRNSKGRGSRLDERIEEILGFDTPMREMRISSLPNTESPKTAVMLEDRDRSEILDNLRKLLENLAQDPSANLPARLEQFPAPIAHEIRKAYLFRKVKGLPIDIDFLAALSMFFARLFPNHVNEMLKYHSKLFIYIIDNKRSTFGATLRGNTLYIQRSCIEDLIGRRISVKEIYQAIEDKDRDVAIALFRVIIHEIGGAFFKLSHEASQDLEKIFLSILSKVKPQLSPKTEQEIRNVNATPKLDTLPRTDWAEAETFIHDSSVEGISIKELDKLPAVFMEQAVSELNNALFNSDHNARNSAAQALAQLGSIESLTFLKSIQEKEPQNEIVGQAVTSLEQGVSSSSKTDVTTNLGGIDLSKIELTLKDEKFISNLNPADLKILRAARALKQGQESLAVLYVHEVRLILKDNILAEKDITQRALLQNLLAQLEHRELLNPEAVNFCHVLQGQEILPEERMVISKIK